VETASTAPEMSGSRPISLYPLLTRPPLFCRSLGHQCWRHDEPRPPRSPRPYPGTGRDGFSLLISARGLPGRRGVYLPRTSATTIPTLYDPGAAAFPTLFPTSRACSSLPLYAPPRPSSSMRMTVNVVQTVMGIVLLPNYYLLSTGRAPLGFLKLAVLSWS